MSSQGLTLLSTLRTSAADLADMPISSATTYVTITRWNEWIQRAANALYDILIQKYGADYSLSQPVQFQTDGINYLFALPSDFYKLRAADWLVNGNPGQRISMDQFNIGERNRNANPMAMQGYGFYVPRYRVARGNPTQLWLERFGGLAPPAGNTVELLYTPLLVPLYDSGTITCTGVIVGDSFLLNGRLFSCVTGAPAAGSATFQKGGTDTITATNLTATINSSSLGGMPGVVTATSSLTVVTVTPLVGVNVAWTSGSGVATLATVIATNTLSLTVVNGLTGVATTVTLTAVAGTPERVAALPASPFSSVAGALHDA